MTIDQQTVTKIAQLAKLELNDSDVVRYQNELSNILDLVAQMESCDTSDTEPMTHPFDATLRLRPDTVTEHNQREKFQAIAPAADKGLYVVPKVID